MRMKISKGDIPTSIIAHKPKKGYSQKILDLDIGDSITYPHDEKSIESINNAVKHVRKYLGYKDRLFKTKRISDKSRKIYRIA